MTPLIEDAVLATDLDGRNYALLNLGGLDPVPGNLALNSDVRLSDQREPLPGSVTDDSVAADAAIEQSKLLFDDDIPVAWLGTGSNQAARGDLAEYLSHKNQPGGYPGLDSGGKLASSQLPGTTGTGTVTSVALSMPPEFAVAGSPITAAGTFAVTWGSVPNLSWFGNKQGGAGSPQFYTDPLPLTLIPNMDAAQVTTGVFAAARLPLAVGVGLSHAPGAVPDPGDGSSGALATDYLARDISFKPVPTIAVLYQPTLPDPVITPPTNPTGGQTITPTSTVNATFMYSLTSSSTGFSVLPATGYVSVPPLGTIWIYSARAGYNNSNIVSYTNPNAT
jgi:hypothetical protein